MGELIKQYLKALEHELPVGHTTEHTHRPALKVFLESMASKLTATNEPGRVACGAPDFVLTKPGPVTVGYVETKDIGKSLDDAERSDQLKRYLSSLSNLVLTNYLEFRWYVDGKLHQTATIGSVGNREKIKIDDTPAKILSLLEGFLQHAAEGVSSPKRACTTDGAFSAHHPGHYRHCVRKGPSV
jgi:hypothetical protein